MKARVPLLSLLLAFASTGCAAPAPVNLGGDRVDTLAVGVEHGPESQIHGGVRYMAVAEADFRPPHAFHVWIAAFSPDPARTPRPDARLDPCDVEVRLQRGTQVVWRIGRMADGACPPAGRWKADGGGLHFEIPVADVLGDSVLEGEYKAHVTLKVGRHTLEFQPRSSFFSMDMLPSIDDPTHVEIGGSLAHVSTEHLGVEVLLRNRGARTVRFLHGAAGCGVRIELTSVGEPGRVWKEGRGCVDILHQTFVRPGELLRWPGGGHRVEVRGVLGDSLKEGPYTAAVWFIHGDRGGGLAPDSVRVELGTITLTRHNAGRQRSLAAVRPLVSRGKPARPVSDAGSAAGS